MFKFYINNFRSFRNEEFDFSRVNILIGENSSGKSSLLKFLLAAKQSLQVPNNRNINFTFRGEHADLGSYKESIYYNDDSLSLSFKFTFDQKYSTYFLDFLLSDENRRASSERKERAKEDIAKWFSGEFLEETYVSFELNKELNRHESIFTEFGNPKTGKLKIFPDRKVTVESTALFESPSCDIEFFDVSTKRTYLFSGIEYQPQGFLTLLIGTSLKASIKKHFSTPLEEGNPTELHLSANSPEADYDIDGIFYKIAFLLVSQNYVLYRLSKIDFINPIATKPMRVFLNSDETNNPSIKNIEDVVDFLSRNNPTSRSALTALNEIVKKFGIAEKIEIVQDNRLPVKELKVQIKDLVSNIMDVGYGVVLQLPILLKSLLAEKIPSRRDSILIIEQPEVHLHPKLHASFIEALLSLGDKNIYFIETHSEHIIRKIQVMVKEEKFGVKSKDISINYLVRVERESVKTEHRISPDGFLVPSFPSGFFDNSYLMSLNLLK